MALKHLLPQIAVLELKVKLHKVTEKKPVESSNPILNYMLDFISHVSMQATLKQLKMHILAIAHLK